LSQRDQFLASAFRDLDAHGFNEPRRDVVTVIAKECERGGLREGRCGSVCVKMRIEQRLGNEVISEPIVGDEDNFLVRRVLVPYRLFNQYAFDNQPAIQRTLELAPWQQGVDTFFGLGQREPALPRVDERLRKGLQSPTHQGIPRIEAEHSREAIIDRAEVQVEYGGDAVEPTGQPTLALCVEAAAERFQEERVAKLRREERRRRQLEPVVDEEGSGGIVLVLGEALMRYGNGTSPNFLWNDDLLVGGSNREQHTDPR
jgi:hypothetical protein